MKNGEIRRIAMTEEKTQNLQKPLVLLRFRVIGCHGETQDKYPHTVL